MASLLWANVVGHTWCFIDVGNKAKNGLAYERMNFVAHQVLSATLNKIFI